jgi:peptidyl-prolyl cis-trans isomerase A (cyclophilin A)
MPISPNPLRRLALRLAGSLAAAAAGAVATLPVVAAAQQVNQRVTLQTGMGNIVIELYRDKAPGTVDNFLAYVKSGFYDGLVFHRVVRGQLIQGGGYDKSLQPRATRARIRNEANNGLSNQPLTVAMARGVDPDSATSQFFINLQNNSQLDYPSFDGAGYCVFGKVVEGEEAIDRISHTETTQRPNFEALPVAPIVIEKAYVNK